MANFYKKSSQLGRSMIEMLGVLAIIGVLSIGSISGYTKAMEKYKINKLKDQFITIVTNLTPIMRNEFKGWLVTPAVIDAMHILPDEMGTTANCRHALGGRCFVGNGGYRSITIRFADLPTSACVEMAMLQTSAIDHVSINATNNMTEGNPGDCDTEDGTQTCIARNNRTMQDALYECRGKKNTVIFFLWGRR